MKNLFINKKAMTIPELIIVVVLITIVLGAAIMPYIMQQDLLKKQMAISKLQDEVSVALAYIEKDAFCASKAAVSGTSDETLTLITIDYNTLDAATSSGFAETTIVYTLNSGNITKDGTTIASKITALTFATVGANYVEIDIIGVDRGQTISMDLGVALRAVAA